MCTFSHSFDFVPVHYLSAFFCDRLKDSPLITPYVLQGLQALASNSPPLPLPPPHTPLDHLQATHHHLSDEDAVVVVRTVFKEIHTQVRETQGWETEGGGGM